MLNPLFLSRMKEYLGDEYDAFLASYNDDNIRGLRVNSLYSLDTKFDELFDYNVSEIEGLKDCYYLKDNNLMNKER